MTDFDDSAVRSHVQAHADAVLRGDTPALLEDFAEEARPLLRELGRALPRPVTAAEVVSVEDSPEGGVALIRYAGGEQVTVVRSTWAERDGRLRIVAAAATD